MPDQKGLSILIIQTAFIGDVVLATTLIESLHNHFPDAKIDFLLRKGNESLLLNHPYLNKVLIFDKKNRKYLNLIRLISKVRSRNYDHVINVQRFFASGLITAFSGAKSTSGFDKNPFSKWYTHVVEHRIFRESGTHETQRNHLLISHIVSGKESKPKLYPSKDDYTIVPEKTAYVCIAPASVWFTKQFPADRWIDLIKHLPKNLKVFLIGAKSDRDLCEYIRDRCEESRVQILAGELNFLQSAALISGAKMTFANDSAPVHIASAMNAPVSEIYCSTIPEFGFGPLSDVSFIFEHKGKLDCRPCNLHGRNACPLGHFKCSEIEIQTIIKETGMNT